MRQSERERAELQPVREKVKLPEESQTVKEKVRQSEQS